MESRSSVTVRKFDIECQMPAAADRSQAVAGRLANIARKGLREALSQCLEPLQAGGEEILFIRSLQLDMDIDLLLDEREIARLWADRIKTEMLSALKSGSGAPVVLFASPAAYLSAALLAIARGCARDLWYYRSFDGLWPLPVSAALRTALLNDPDSGVAALAQTQSRDLVELCAVLCAADAQRILDGLFPALPPGNINVEDASAFTRCMAAEYGLAHNLQGRIPEKTLLLAALALGAQAPLSLAQIGTCARCLSLLMDLQQRYARDFPEMLAALSMRKFSKLKRWLSAGEITRLSTSDFDKSELISSLGTIFQVGNASQNSGGKTQISEDITLTKNTFTPFGNALLLLPLINALPLSTIEQWPALKKQPALPLLRWLVLCACQGADRFYSAAQDPLLRDLCGVGPNAVMEDISAWLNHLLTPQQNLDLFSDLGNEFQPGEHEQEFLQWQSDEAIFSVHRESKKGCWISMRLDDPDGVGPTVPQPQGREASELVRKDFDCLWLPARLQFNDSARALIVVLAQFTLKSLAWRLPGFADCSVPYLLSNFLGMSVRLVTEEERIIAYLSRVPMNVILNMAGLNRGSLRLPDFDRREIRLATSA